MEIKETNLYFEGLHPRNKHVGKYNFAQLIKTHPDLNLHVGLNKAGEKSIDFSNPIVVKALNKALLMHFYNLDYWNIPKTNLCPPIPGRAEYIHHIADLLAASNEGVVPTGPDVRILDIGVGANCIYPIIGHNDYGWTFVGTDVDKQSLFSAENILDKNPNLKAHVTLRFNDNKRHVLKNMIRSGETFDFVICNPPFHASLEEASKSHLRKSKNLGQENMQKAVLNFSGHDNELWCLGGELSFVTNMIYESVHFENRCKWFSSLVSKKANLKPLYKVMKKVGVTNSTTIHLSNGNKTTQIICWHFR